MSSVWMLIETRGARVEGLSATSKIAGLSLIARHARMAARQGWAGAVVQVADADSQRSLAQALDRQPPRAGFVVEFVSGDEAPPEGRSYVPVKLFALYAADELAAAAASGTAPRPFIEIASQKDARAADQELYRRIRKNIDQDGVVSYFLFRPLSTRMTRLVIDTPIMPNHVTLLAMAAGIAAAISASFGTYGAFALAGVLYWIGAVVDCVDGEIARLRMQGSKLGEWLDTLADDVSTYGLLTGSGLGLLRGGYDPAWATLAIGSAVAGALIQVKLYADLHRMGGTIDTAQYPWFFGTPSQGNQGTGGLGKKLLYGVSFLFRRDTFVTIIAALLLCNQPLFAVAILSGGIAIVAVLFLVHHLVTAVRGARAT